MSRKTSKEPSTKKGSSKKKTTAKKTTSKQPIKQESVEKKPAKSKKKQIEELFAMLEDNFPLYAETLLKIRTKEGDLVPFVLNEEQMAVYMIIQHLRKLGRPIRIICLKSRQIGFSTFCEAFIFKETTWKKLTHSLIIAHEDDASTNLFNMSKLFNDELPIEFKPMQKASNAKELVFENPTNDPVAKRNNPGLRSRMRIATAKNPGVGRSDTMRCVHGSEVAFWPDAKTTLTGLLQMVPKTPDSMVFLESTANGVGGHFHELWQAAKKGENDFIPIFFPWYRHKEYTMEVPPGFERTDEEIELAKSILESDNFTLTDGQLAWRRWCIKNNCSGDVDMFKQEYPSNDIEAFLTTGTPVFDPKIVTNRMLQLRAEYKENPPLIGEIECDYTADGDPIKGTERFVPSKKGRLIIYELPQPGVPYVIGGDIAEGGIDYSVGQVLNNITGKQAAKWRGHVDTDLFAKYMYSLGYYYNIALEGIEVNFDLHPVKELQRLKYPKQYRRESIDSITSKPQEKLGFLTSAATRGPIIGELVAIVRDNPELINDIETLEEMLTFVRNDRGRPEAMAGSHDDCVMALAIAYKIRDQQVSRKKEGKKEDYTHNMGTKAQKHLDRLLRRSKRKKVRFL